MEPVTGQWVLEPRSFPSASLAKDHKPTPETIPCNFILKHFCCVQTRDKHI